MLALVPALALAQAARNMAHLDIRHNMPFIKVIADCKGPFTIGIDTGAGGEALVSPELAKQLGLTPVGDVELATQAGCIPSNLPSLN